MEHPDVQEGEQKWQKYLHLMAGIKEDGARLLRGDQRAQTKIQEIPLEK